MNRYFSSTLPTRLVLLAMLLNPILGLAASLPVVEFSGTATIQNSTLNATTAGQAEHCREYMQETASSTEAEPMNCCESNQCNHSDCHVPVSAVHVSSASVTFTVTHFLALNLSYRSPTLKSISPPPIA